LSVYGKAETATASMLVSNAPVALVELLLLLLANHSLMIYLNISISQQKRKVLKVIISVSLVS